jgi:hypothetical protein
VDFLNFLHRVDLWYLQVYSCKETATEEKLNAQDAEFKKY